MPFTILTMYFELNVYKDISFYTTILYFALGGALSILATLFLYEIIPDADDFNLLGAMLVSIIEETGKAAVAIAIIKRTKNATFLHGLLIGGAVGCGFAVFESAGYAFNVYLNAHDWNQRLDMYNNLVSSSYQRYDYANSLQEMNLNIFIRSILSFGGHTAWTAITGSYFAKEKKININFLNFFGICFALHAIWDTTTAGTWVKLAFLCIAAWYVILKQISVFITEQNKAKAPV